VLGRLAPRLVLGVVLAFLPLTAILATLLVRNSSRSLETSIREGLRNDAVTLAARVDVRFQERRQDLRSLARGLARVPRASAGRYLRAERGPFETVQLVDRSGRLLASTDAAPSLADPTSGWLAGALRGAETRAEPVQRDGTLRTLLAQPVGGRPGAAEAVLLGDLDESILASFVTALRIGRTGEAVIRDRDGSLIWRTALGPVASPRDMAAQRPLADRAVSGAPGLALRGDTGTTRFTASTGREALGGYAPASVPGWSADVRQDTSEAFAPIYEQRDLAIAIALIGSLLVTAFAVWVARRTVAPIKELAASAHAVARGDLRVRADPRGPDEVRGLGESFNEMVASLASLAGQIRAAGADMASSSAELSSAAQELAATTTQQSTAATQTSSTMEELAQTSARIADSVDVVAQRTLDTRTALARADEGMSESGERIASLIERAGEVDRITALINELADRTDLLALNAAIEAARAGEAGAGFGVVAEEVRLLAERSKNEAAKIAEIVQRARLDTSAAARAMERGSTDMRHGVELMEEVADSTSEVRLTTDQQRVATGQVVETMLSVSSATKQTATTAQQIASASSALADLAARLRDASSAFVTSGEAGDGGQSGHGDLPAADVAADAWPGLGPAPAAAPAPASPAVPAPASPEAAGGNGYAQGPGDGTDVRAGDAVPRPRP